MNLYLRLIWIVLKASLANKCDLLAESRIRLRVLPFDCDLNWHLNNARYLSFMDLGRIHLIGQAGLYRTLYQRHWSPILLAAEISFIKALKPLEHFELITRIISWDETYLYLEQRFEKEGQLVALAYVKGLFIGRTGKVPTTQLWEVLGLKQFEAPPMPEVIKCWKNLSAVKKNS